MLTFTNSEDRQNQCFHLLGTAKTSNNSVHLISKNTSLISANTSLLNNCGMDSYSFSNGVSGTALSFGEQAESCGSIAYDGGIESCGSIASSSFGGFSAVSTSSSCGSSFSGGGCSYSC